MCVNEQMYPYDGRGFLWIQNENLNFCATKLNGRCIDFDAQCMIVDTDSLNRRAFCASHENPLITQPKSYNLFRAA